ncbi:T9SS type A sorting domain-containing protein [Patiriisocius hiemis]|uniref:T9SS type A sorting domain-containing protein n=1 Tax=Patiriisocius hiemis TaxID=3075604 RepID=A0ABU2YEY6_9FLAO|nr:T9SS type A sorting domain-containing protein [Constantimarinum sp. W242]MDT0555805.1 T9SS type A sorting domain-containing protein [Constantimarinum sp. W242]
MNFKKLYPLLIIFFIWEQPLCAQIINFPDPNFKDALVNSPCVSFTGDCDDPSLIDADFNDDGEIDMMEAELIQVLCFSNVNNITSVEGIEHFVNLNYLSVGVNDLTSLDVSQNTLLEYIGCPSNEITSINLGDNPNLIELSCSNNLLTSIDISQNPNLEVLNVSSNTLNSISVSSNVNLKRLTIRNNNLNDMDISQNINLESISIQENSLTTLDISNNINLMSFNISGNQFTELPDITNNPLLAGISCADNFLTELHVDEAVNPNITLLSCVNNLITQITIPTTVEQLNIRENPITGEIDLTQMTALWSARLNDTQISGLNIQNGANDMLQIFDVFNTPNLSCIQVDDVQAIQQGGFPYNNWDVDNTLVFSENCSELGVEDTLENSIGVFPNPVANFLYVTTISNYAFTNFTIHNLQGEVVKKGKYTLSIDMSKLSTGIYFITVETDDSSITKKIIKK